MSDSTGRLVRGFAGGDATAFEALYARLAPQLYLWSSLRIPRPLWARLDPEDLVQEVWMRATAALERFDPARGGFRTWLFGIAARTLAEQLRRLSVRRREGGGGAGDTQLQQVPAPATSIVRGAMRTEQLRRFVDLAAGLPPLDRHLLLHRGLEERPHAEVGAGLGISAEAAEMRWRRLLGRLRAQWSAAGLGALE